jgi:hypothetical protein
MGGFPLELIAPAVENNVEEALKGKRVGVDFYSFVHTVLSRDVECSRYILFSDSAYQSAPILASNVDLRNHPLVLAARAALYKLVHKDAVCKQMWPAHVVPSEHYTIVPISDRSYLMGGKPEWPKLQRVQAPIVPIVPPTPLVPLSPAPARERSKRKRVAKQFFYHCKRVSLVLID